MGSGVGEALAAGGARRRVVWGGLVAVLLLGSGALGYWWPREARAVLRRMADPLVLARVERFGTEIRAAAEESGLDPCLVAAIVYSESSGDPTAVSRADAVGLMQLLPAATEDSARRLRIDVPTPRELLEDPALNLRLGASHFAWTLRNEGDDVERALVAYNAGRTKLRRWIKAAGSYEAWRAERKRAGDSPTLAYAGRVMEYAEVFRERGRIPGADAR